MQSFVFDTDKAVPPTAWPEDDEEMYKLFFGDEDEDDDNADAASPSNKDLLVPGGVALFKLLGLFEEIPLISLKYLTESLYIFSRSCLYQYAKKLKEVKARYD